MRRKPNSTRALLLVTAAAAAVLALAIPALAHNGDGDGRFDDDPAGTIASFDQASGLLTIDLADGGSISGLVTRFTWIDGDGSHCGGGGGRRARTWCRHGDRGRHNGDDDWRYGHGDTDDLVSGATVDDAVLVLKDGRSFFAKVDLDD